MHQNTLGHLGCFDPACDILAPFCRSLNATNEFVQTPDVLLLDLFFRYLAYAVDFRTDVRPCVGDPRYFSSCGSIHGIISTASYRL